MVKETFQIKTLLKDYDKTKMRDKKMLLKAVKFVTFINYWYFSVKIKIFF